MRDIRFPRTRSLIWAVLLSLGIGLIALGQTGLLDPVKGLLLIPLVPIQTFVAQRFGQIGGGAAGGDDNPAQLRARNAELEARVAKLEAQLVDYEELKAQNRVLSALLDYARAAPENRYVTADVIGRDESPFLQYIILNKGSNAGLARNMPVLTDSGLIGQITEVTSDAVKVLLITDPASAVNARVQSSRAEGVVVGQLTGDLRMQYISLDAQVKPGDLVLTSGLGGRYPANLLIGQIASVRKRTQDVFQEADIRPLNNFGALEIVLVLTNFKPVNVAPILGTPAP